jgi:DNA-binding response OmpR family regulator
MKYRALVIDDDKEIIRTVGDVLTSLNHAYDSAGDQESARKMLVAGKYDYILLDLEIPVRPGRLCRIENGKNLIREIRKTPGIENLPVIVMTGHGNDSPDLAVSVMRTGADHYVKKPFAGDELDKAIREVLARDKQSDHTPRTKTEHKTLTPFNAEKREMVIEEERVTVCGVEVWQDCYQPDMRNVLMMLNRKEGGHYVRIKGSKLMKDLGRDPSNPLGKPISSFRANASNRLKEQCGLECGKQDIIASGQGGYYFTEWMDVHIVGSTAREPKNEPTEKRSGPANENVLNERQKWILEQLEKGVKLRYKDIVRHTNKDRSTINRDLKVLRDQQSIASHDKGYYVQAKAVNKS